MRRYDFFYHKEHLIIVAELLRDNLYESIVTNAVKVGILVYVSA